MEINGLPLHPLVVHAAVVFGPLSAVAGVLYGVVPKWRNWLRWPLVTAVTIALVTIWVSYFSGEDFKDDLGIQGELIETHEERANILRWSITAFAVVTYVTAWFHTHPGKARSALAGVVAGLAVLTLVYTVLTGDAGAQLVWGGAES
jgi:uncharacterized membrane protein